MLMHRKNREVAGGETHAEKERNWEKEKEGGREWENFKKFNMALTCHSRGKLARKTY